ncbi:related to E.coli prolyl-tRNA synthetase [Rhynchosporium secalis]|uniref:proline--tRNA ligase n=1 Tax=Rhynchosporium secalis TaxID=38038 RepID=A0A1E1MG08_RHYSE|nr:related to E.coli prolyl-tRNA synthetase [Rhynchosporium secalis]
MWVPTGGIAASVNEDSHAKLIRAGFLRQAYSGIFHMLPLGRRVQDKLEALIDKYMFQLGASKLALSSISSEELWAKSGRLANTSSELFRFSDRRNAKYLLSPTHEEEITTLVSSTVSSYNQLPVRLYQISRKYRDELRPRHGLLRSREFIMKDLYTFDNNSTLALATYQQVKEVYARLFDELKLPYLVAEADSGDMGGNLSHEFHFPTSKGEDHIISCSTCDYVANEELAESPICQRQDEDIEDGTQSLPTDVRVWRGITRDRLSLVNVWYQSPDTVVASSTDGHEINMHAIKAILPYFDPSIDDPLSLWMKSHEVAAPQMKSALSESRRLINLVDSRLPKFVQRAIELQDSRLPIFPKLPGKMLRSIEVQFFDSDQSTQRRLNLLRIRDGDLCPRCTNGPLKVQKAIELGHTFYLGTRYSEPMSASVAIPIAEKSDVTENVPLQMGCHGIGVSRIIGAVADTLADSEGLNWPRVMAPFEVVVVPSNENEEAAIAAYDIICKTSPESADLLFDIVIDDRAQPFGKKMKDADLVGYPIIIVVGRKWTEGVCEVQCRRLKKRQEIHIRELRAYIRSLLAQL